MSAQGNYYGSTLVEVRVGDPPSPTLSLAAGLALIEAVDAGIPGQPMLLKWPNDLMLSGRKLAGILLERSGDRIAVGFGVNLATPPALADRQTASLGAQLSPQSFAPLLAGSFARLLELWRRNEPELVGRAWLARAHPIGTPITVHPGKDETISGRFAGLEADGAMRLQLAGGSIEVVRAGDVALD